MEQKVVVSGLVVSGLVNDIMGRRCFVVFEHHAFQCKHTFHILPAVGDDTVLQIWKEFFKFANQSIWKSKEWKPSEHPELDRRQYLKRWFEERILEEKVSSSSSPPMQHPITWYGSTDTIGTVEDWKTIESLHLHNMVIRYYLPHKQLNTLNSQQLHTNLVQISCSGSALFPTIQKLFYPTEMTPEAGMLLGSSAVTVASASASSSSSSSSSSSCASSTTIEKDVTPMILFKSSKSWKVGLLKPVRFKSSTSRTPQAYIPWSRFRGLAKSLREELIAQPNPLHPSIWYSGEAEEMSVFDFQYHPTFPQSAIDTLKACMNVPWLSSSIYVPPEPHTREQLISYWERCLELLRDGGSSSKHSSSMKASKLDFFSCVSFSLFDH